MDLSEYEHIVAVWFVSGPDANGDWMATIGRKKGEARLTLEYRFRYYKDDRAFDSNDVKSFYSATQPETMEDWRFVHEVDVLATLMLIRFPGTVDRVDINGDAEAFFEKVSKRPWANFKKVPIS